MVNAPPPPLPPAAASAPPVVPVIATVTTEGATLAEFIAWIMSAPEPDDGRAER